MSDFNVLLLVAFLVGVIIVCIYIILNDPDLQRNQRKKQFIIGKRVSKIRSKDERKELARQQQLSQKLKKLDLNQSSITTKSLEFKLAQAGMVIKPITYRLIFLGLGFFAAIPVYISTNILFIALGLLFFITFLGPRMHVNKRVDKRQRKFVELLPQALDVLIRGVKSGSPISDCIRIAATEIEDPVGGEFRFLSDQLAIGLPMDRALDKFYARMPVKEVNFLRIVLLIQRQSGGNLSEALKNLSDMIRGRKRLKNKIKALSAESKTAATIIGSLPLFVMIIVYLMSPDYIIVLFEDRRGTIALLGGFIWMCIGGFIMRKMMDFKV